MQVKQVSCEQMLSIDTMDKQIRTMLVHNLPQGIPHRR